MHAMKSLLKSTLPILALFAGWTVPAAADVSPGATKAAADAVTLPVTTRMVLPGSAATSAKTEPGAAVSFEMRIDAPTVRTVGTAYRLTQTAPAASGFFSITGRSVAGSPFNDPSTGTSEAAITKAPGNLLAPTNQANLGLGTAGLVAVAPANGILLATITLAANATTPLGTYRIQPTDRMSVVTDATGKDWSMSDATFDIVVGRTLEVTRSGTGTGRVTADTGAIDCGTVCTDIYPGAVVKLTAVAAPGSVFDGWTGATCPGSGTCTVTVDRATTVGARFNAQSGPPEASANYQGLWWNSPGGSESGWGVNLNHDGDTIFATWFTFDVDGAPLWFVVGADRTAANAFAGTLYRGTGPAYNAVPFDPAKVNGVVAGTATFTFADSGTGTFAYTIGGVSQSKPIVRQVFATPVPTCTWGTAPAAATITNYQGLWWAAPGGTESGWGINFTHQGDVIFATWFTFGLDGKPLWLTVAANKTAPKVYSGRLYTGTGPAFSTVPFDPALVKPVEVGTAKFTFSDGINAAFAYTVNGAAQTKAITREVIVPPGTYCK